MIRAIGTNHSAGNSVLTPSISLYVPCYNAAAYLARVLEGALAQTLPADEVIVVDDGSRDSSAEIAGRFPVTLLRQERNRGLAAARNTAMRAARNPRNLA